MDQVGPYRVVREIARGGMGVVLHARGPRMEEVALKLLLAQRAANPQARQRFMLEARTLSRLRHPNVVSILAVGEHEGAAWLALEYVAGETLQDRLRGGPLAIDDALNVAQQVAQALVYVHSCGVLHRDLKPENLLLHGAQVRLTDFGLTVDDDASQSRFTATGVFLGTPGYWAPEQARVSRHACAAYTDVYGLGAVLYACLTGGPPVQAGSLYEFLEEARFRKVAPPHQLRPDVPRWLSRLCMRCLAFEPGDRPASAEEVARGLLLGEDAPPVEAQRDSRVLIVALFALLALGLVGITVSAVWLLAPTGDDPLPATQPAAKLPPADDSATPAPSPPSSPGEAEGEFRMLEAEALRLSRLGEHEAALEVLARMLELRPDTSLLYAKRGVMYLELGRHDDAVAELDRGLAIDPNDADSHIARGAALHGLKRHADAIEALSRSVELRPDSASARYTRALVYADVDRHADAVRDLNRVIELDPTRAPAYLARAKSLGALERYEEALPDYERGIVEGKARPLDYAGRAYSKYRTGRYRSAIEDFNRSLSLDPDNPNVLADRGLTYRKLEDTERAFGDLDRAIQLDPESFHARLNRGLLHNELKQYAGVIEDLDVVLRLRPTQAGAHTMRGLAHFNLGDFPKALADFESGLKLHPDDAMCRINRGMCYSNLKRYDEALADYDYVLERGLVRDANDLARLQAMRRQLVEGLKR